METGDRRRRRSDKRQTLPSHHVKLHTEALADQRRQSRREREETECTQFLRIKQKLAGKKTTDEYARIRLVRRQDPAAMKQNLHQNGKKSVSQTTSSSITSFSVSLPSEKPVTSDASRIHPLTAREESHAIKEHAPDARRRVRPQSAKPLRNHEPSHHYDGVAGQRVSVELLEKCYYNPIPLTTHLSMSRSAPRLQAALGHAKSMQKFQKQERLDLNAEEHRRARLPQFTEEHVDAPGKRRIVVYMQHLEVQDGESSLDEQCEESKSILSSRNNGR